MNERRRALVTERKRRQRLSGKGREDENLKVRKRRRHEPVEVRLRRLGSLRSYSRDIQEAESRAADRVTRDWVE